MNDYPGKKPLSSSCRALSACLSWTLRSAFLLLLVRGISLFEQNLISFFILQPRQNKKCKNIVVIHIKDAETHLFIRVSVFEEKQLEVT